jgi:hypothetical protein
MKRQAKLHSWIPDYKALMNLVPNQDRREARMLLNQIIKFSVIHAFNHVHANIAVLCETGVDYPEYSIMHDSEVDGG